MTLTIRVRTVVLAAALIGALVGMAISQIAFAGAGTARTSAASLYPVIKELQKINAVLGTAPGGSIAPVLREIEKNTYYGCAAAQGHHFGGCSQTGW